MGVASTTCIRSCALTEQQADEIRYKVHLFGYAPQKVRLGRVFHLIMHSDRDCEIVRTLRDQTKKRIAA